MADQDQNEVLNSENEDNVQVNLPNSENQKNLSMSVDGTNVSASISIPPSVTAEPTVGDDVGRNLRGLPIRELISAPLIAVCEAQQQLAYTALDYYKRIAYEEDEKTTRLLTFDLERPVETPGGINVTKVKVQAPFIGLVPIPSLLISNVNIDFQMEVTDANTKRETTSADLSTAVTSKFFTNSVSIQGKVATSRENTRSTSQTAKYQVHVTASQQPQTEGLSKLMDIMASCVEPLSISNA